MNRLLIVVDMQNDFIDGSLGTAEAVAIVPNVVRKIKEYRKERNTKICFTQDTHSEDYLNTSEGKLLPVKHCIYRTKGWEISQEIREAFADDELLQYQTICKPTFGSLNLLHIIQEEYIEQCIPIDEIEIVGLCTDICVVSNALILKAALYNKSIVTVDASCCAGVTPEKHRAALEVMKSCQIHVIGE